MTTYVLQCDYPLLPSEIAYVGESLDDAKAAAVGVMGEGVLFGISTWREGKQLAWLRGAPARDWDKISWLRGAPVVDWRG